MSRARPHQLGRYELLSRIAKGGMAEIYLARQLGLVGFSQLVVVKRILPHLAEEPHFVEMFMDEARLAAQVNHSNVVQIYDLGQDGDDYFIAMEFIRGPGVGAINRRARRAGVPVPYPVAAEIIAQACDGLSAAHSLTDDAGEPLNLVHRDISPHNLMINLEGLVKLVDFGIAKARSTSVRTNTGSIKGKFPYMSPEQCRGEPLDCRADLFSLGIVFSELVTARRLFQRATELMTLKAITEDPIPDPRTLNPYLPVEIAEVIRVALKRDPQQRFASARDMGVAVREAIARLSLDTSPRTLADYVQRYCGDLTAEREALAKKLAGGAATPVSVGGGADRLGRSVAAGRSGAGAPANPPSDQAAVEDALTVPQMSRRSAPTQPVLSVAPLASAGPRRRWFKIWLLALLAVGCGAVSGLAYRCAISRRRPEGPALRFGFAPAFPVDVSRRELAPLMAYLEHRLQRRVELEISRDYQTLRQGLASGRFAFANLPPLQFVQARRRDPLLTAVVMQTYEGARTYQGYIVVPADSSIRSIAELRGTRFCYVERGSASGYLLPRLFLRRSGLDPDRLFRQTRFSKTHVGVMRDLVADRCDAGAVYAGALVAAQEVGIPSSRLQVRAVTGELPFDVICASPELPKATVDQMQQALLELEPKRDLGRRTVGGTFYRISKFVLPRLTDFSALQQAAAEETP